MQQSELEPEREVEMATRRSQRLAGKGEYVGLGGWGEGVGQVEEF